MAECAATINSELARFCELLMEADQAQEWLADGSPHPVQWMTARFHLDPKFGRRLLKVAKRLEDLPEMKKRFAAGRLSLDQVEILSEVATPETELDLINDTGDADLHDLARLASRERPPTAKESADERAKEWLGTQWDLHRKWMLINGRLYGVGAQMVEDRLVAKAQTMPKNLETGRYDDWDKRMADALIETCATEPDGKTPVPTIVLHADISVFEGEASIDLAELTKGPVISSELAEMLGCHASIETTVHKDGAVVGIGRKSRSIPGWLRRQVEYRDHHCRTPGCDRTVFLQIHHLVPWALGGQTELDNLILICWWHHLFIHEKGWHITRGLDGRFVFRKPDWSIYPPRPI